MSMRLKVGVVILMKQMSILMGRTTKANFVPKRRCSRGNEFTPCIVVWVALRGVNSDFFGKLKVFVP